jgi:hypothetical protein
VPLTAYSLGAVVVPDPRNGHTYTVTVAGTSGAATPIWPTTTAASVVDGTVTWAESGPTYWTPTYNLPMAAAEGWEWKASKAAKDYDVSAGSVNATRHQVFDMCKEQASRYRKMSGPGGTGGIGSIGLTTTCYRWY